MTAPPVLTVHGLHKRFASLVVAHEIGFALPQGARHALIGPNGAGKTTLINLLTGALRPDAGEVLLAGEPITTLAPHLRVKRGLARTFQINTLFPELDPLEAVTLAVCQRCGTAGNFWRPVPAFRAAIEEAHAILASLGLATVCHRPTRALAYGQQRLLELALALATRPKVLLLDEPAAGVPRHEASALFAAIEALSADLTVLFIEHDMNIVFRFASRVIVLLGGRILVEGTPQEIAADPRVREVYLGGVRHHDQCQTDARSAVSPDTNVPHA
jgi:branched-chain amino acid transport system ATP-binding protein